MKRLLNTIITLTILLLSVPLAEAIDITLAEVRNGVAVVQGSKAAKQTMIVWETDSVGQTTKGGGFSFSGIVSADCVGQLRIGTDTINVALNNCTRLAPAPVPKTGQTTSFAPGDDGDIQAGVPLPTPRFTDNEDGTVQDNLTGLIWLKNAQCVVGQAWLDALNTANTLASGNCGLTDGSVAGDWRLPNVRELQSLIDFNHPLHAAIPAGSPFINVLATRYWSSTTPPPPNDIYAWTVDFGMGGTALVDKPSSNTFVGPHLWPVRGPK
jgi:hypothetical protein